MHTNEGRTRNYFFHFFFRDHQWFSGCRCYWPLSFQLPSLALLGHTLEKVLLQWSCWLAWQVDPFQIICTHTLSLSTNKLERLQNTLNWSFVIKLIYLALGSMCPFLSSCLYPRSTVCTVSPAHKVSVFRFFRSTRPRPRMIRGLAREMEHSATCRLWNCNWKTGNCSNVTKEIINHPYFDGLYIHVYTTHKNGFYGTFGDGLRLLY